MSQEENQTVSKELFLQYSAIRKEIEELKEKEGVLKQEIEETMDILNLKKVNSDDGVFTLRNNKKYTFPQYVVDAENQYKTIKDNAKKDFESVKEDSIEKGDTEVEIIKTLSYKQND